MDPRLMRNRLFAALSDEFPDASVAHLGKLNFIVQQHIDGASLAIPVAMSLEEAASARMPDALVSAYVEATRRSWDTAINSRNLQKSVGVSAPSNTGGLNG